MRRGVLGVGVLGVGVLGDKLLRGGEFPNKGPVTIRLVFLGPFGFSPFTGDLSADPLLGIGGFFSQPFICPLGGPRNMLFGNAVDVDISTLIL